jgi:hypothetical protein
MSGWYILKQGYTAELTDYIRKYTYRLTFIIPALLPIEAFDLKWKSPAPSPARI